jgi:hypothetical protein
MHEGTTCRTLQTDSDLLSKVDPMAFEDFASVWTSEGPQSSVIRKECGQMGISIAGIVSGLQVHCR